MIAKIKRYLPPALLSLTFLLTYICLYFGGLPLLDDPDTSWHLATGMRIINEGNIPATDSWSFASANEQWYIISWLWDVLIAAIDNLLGLKGVYLFTLIFASAVATLLAYSLCERKDVGSDALILTLFIVALCFIDFATARPQLVGYLCIVWMQLLLHRSRSDERLERLWGNPALMLILVNTHGSFIAGFTLIGAYGLEALIARRWSWFKHLCVIGVACALVTLVNPYGFYIYAAVMRTLGGVLEHFVIEWQPFVFGKSLGISVWFMLFIVLGCLRESKVPLADKIISLLWFLAMLASMRNAAVFFLVSAPAIAISLQGFSEQWAHVRTTRPDVLQLLSEPSLRLRVFALAACVPIASIVLLDVVKPHSLATPARDPGPAIAWLKEHAVGKRIFNEYDYGGRLIYETRGTVPIFADGRADTAYSRTTLTEYLAIISMEKGWEKLIAKYRVDGIFVGNQDPFAVSYVGGQFHDKWKEVFRDDVASVYLRRR
jgi:hypothetical protein